MEGAAVPGRLNWLAARVTAVIDETPRVRTLELECPDWPGHLAGQHVDVRLTAEDGYEAQRSYSIASAPEDERLSLTIERLDDGEVSPYLCDALVPGDSIELRGPIGGYFVWTESSGGPVLLVAGGSGVVPLRSMLRHRIAIDSAVPMRLLYSARSAEEIIYSTELRQMTDSDGVEVTLTLTRAWPESWTGYRRRIDREILGDVAWDPGLHPLNYVCGPTAFVEAVASELVDLGHPAERILTERFGPTG